MSSPAAPGASRREVAISNSRIIKVEDHKVFFKYKKPHSNRWRTMKLDVIELVRLRRVYASLSSACFAYRIHSPRLNFPVGTLLNRVKIRYYGFLSPGSSVPLEKIHALIELSFGFEITKPERKIEPFDPPKCNLCGGRLKCVISIPPFELIRFAPG